MDLQSRLSLENHPIIVDLKTARAANTALLKRTALEQRQKQKSSAAEAADQKSDAHGIGFSVARLVGGHTQPDTAAPAAPAPAQPPEALAGAGFF